ncbi:hypothetical protein ACSBL2_16085 [Pedobacter sp. AW31-3R]|uniref:hypothetical protein n=1 Tax=Pedobacter sp. AW31-3R TaxID=3445781 RepID=UPI003FA10558
MKFIFTLLLIFSGLFCRAQDLSLDQLISYLDQPAQAITDTLSARGWQANAELSDEKDNERYTTFSFGNKESDKNQALAWLRIHAYNQIVVQLFYQLPGEQAYHKLMATLKSRGTEKKEMQHIENKQINTFYETSDHTFQTIVGGGSYTLLLKKKDD